MRTKQRQIVKVQKSPASMSLFKIQKSCINTLVHFSLVVNINTPHIKRGDKTIVT